MGHLRPEFAPNLRSTLVWPYVIFYRVEGDIVQIIRILHGKRNLLRIMRKELKYYPGKEEAQVGQAFLPDAPDLSGKNA
jgi:ParE-like toxin of type II ParDE toxin-antitoxin system